MYMYRSICLTMGYQTPAVAYNESMCTHQSQLCSVGNGQWQWSCICLCTIHIATHKVIMPLSFSTITLLSYKWSNSQKRPSHFHSFETHYTLGLYIHADIHTDIHTTFSKTSTQLLPDSLCWFYILTHELSPRQK